MLHSGGSTILVYLKISRECFVLLLIMMNSEQDKDAAIRTYTGNPKFRDLLKKILGGSDTRKRVDNFLDNQEMTSQNFNNPAGLPQDLYEATMRQYGRKEFGDYTTDDMKLIIEAQKNKGLV